MGKPSWKGRHLHQPNLQMGKLRLRGTPLPYGQPAQVQRLGLSLLFIELQVEMCRFCGASPPIPAPLDNKSYQRQEMGVEGLG